MIELQAVEGIPRIFGGDTLDSFSVYPVFLF